MRFTFVTALGLFGLLSTACSKDLRSNRRSLDDSHRLASVAGVVVGKCTDNKQRACSITLSNHNDVLSCYLGQQTCVQGLWADCADGSLLSLPRPGSEVTQGLRIKAITGATGCTSNPCDPSCLQLEHNVDAGVGASVLVGDVTDFAWQTGRLSDFPSGLVNKGLKEPCSSGVDCQFNTRCTFPVSGSCTHNKCAVGDALETSCDPCVNDICEANPECCQSASDPLPICAHDPCSVGEALVPECNSCVATICETDPSCCDTSWGPACAAAVTSQCGATCECGTGESSFDESCYFKEEQDLDWNEARDSCQDRGAGWDLVSLTNATENSFVVSSVIDNSQTWIGFTDGNGIGTNDNWSWANATPSGSWDPLAQGTDTATVVPFGSSWKYDASDFDPGPNFASTTFDDSLWPSGLAQFGYGEGDESTVVHHGGASYYFRHSFTLTEFPAAASLEILFDDGYLAYLNGMEFSRSQVDNADHHSFANSFTSNGRLETANIDPGLFLVGENTLTVVLKNGSAFSSDLSFDAEVSVTTPARDDFYENFPSGEPGTEACAMYESNRAGGWIDERCNRNHDSVCEGPAQTMIAGSAPPAFGQWTALQNGSVWKHNSDEQGVDWAMPGYDDSGWPSGPSQLGFGDGDEATALPRLGATYYFRTSVVLPSEISSANMTLTYDDGFAVYVNGLLLDSRNIGLEAYASYASAFSDENETLTVALAPEAFVVGENTIAVMVKNGSSTSSDVSFDMSLTVQLCEQGGCPPDPAWNQACVDAVGSLCSARCDIHEPPASSGQCVSWGPGEVNTDCAGVDLAIGVPCDGTIPVCNHGTVEASPGVRLIHYPANSGHYPNCQPDQSHPGLKECFTTESIAPGECISVTHCPGLVGNREIMVNPPGNSQLGECSCQDNWSLYSNAECGEPVCNSGSSVATLKSKPVDIVFIVDNSGSMGNEIAQVQQRINEDFARIIEDSGVDYRVIMIARYGDITQSIGDANFPICISSPLGGHDCRNPASQPVAHNPGKFYHYSADVGSHNGLCRILEGFDTPDELALDSRVWISVAPQGYGEFLRPEARKAFVVITDDNVDCDFKGKFYKDHDSVTGGQGAAALFDDALLTFAPSQFGTSTDRNYVFHSIVGIKDNSPGTDPWLANAPIQTDRCSPGSESVGTGYQALSVLTGGLRYPSCRNDDFDAIFRALAEDVVDGAVTSCSVALEPQDAADSSKTKVSFFPGNSSANVDLTQVADLGACTDSAYYFEDTQTVTLCPVTCAVVQDDLAGSLVVEVGCAGGETYVARRLRERYESECNDETSVQWSFFTYTTDTPGDSDVAFRLRVADTEAELEDASFFDLTTATSSPDTQVCTFAGPSPCPIDLFEVLTTQGIVHKQFMELEVVLNPTSDASQPATIQNWELSYSCPYSQ